MKGKFTKFKKLLCYVIISLFMFGIGGELVKADTHTITIDSINWLGSYQTARYAKFNVTLDGTTSRYAYCLDAPLEAPSIGTTFTSQDNLLSPAVKLKMINVLLAAGYPNYNYSALGVNNDLDAFYVTQAALWYARYGGTATYRTFTPNFHVKMKNGVYSTGYKYLIAAADSKQTYDVETTKLKLNADNGNTMSEATIGNNNIVLVSDSTFSVSDSGNPKNTSYNVTVTGTNASIYSEDLSTNYGTSHDFTNESDRFKIVIDVDDSAPASQYDASFNVTELNPGTKYDLLTFPGGGSWGWQSMGLLLPIGNTPANTSYSITGNTTDHEYDIPFAKVGIDKNGNSSYIKDTELQIYTSDNKFITSFITTDEPITRKLVPGDYYLKEFSNPGGYAINNSVVNFTVANDGTLTSGGNQVEIVSLSDEHAYITLKKVTVEGQPVEGAVIVIYWKNKQVGDGKYICGKTDSEGYLSQTSVICDSLGNQYGTVNKLSQTGVYDLITDLSYTGFYAENQLYVKEIAAPTGYEIDHNVYAIAGPSGDSIGWYYNHENYMAGDAGDVVQITKDSKTVTEFQFRDNRYINISKVDSIGGQEVPGATLMICRKAANGDCEVDNSPNHLKIYVDYWISEATPHEFVGIEKNVRYILEERYTPEDYELMFKGKLEFELVDDQGTVKMYNHETGEEITNPDKLKAVMPNAPTTKVEISKVDAAGGEEIPGAEIKICTKDAYNSALSTTGDGNNCEATESWTSGTTPHMIKGLEEGDYVLIETVAPAGYYSKTSSTEFTVVRDGRVLSITMPNNVTKLTIKKRNQVTGERIAGAKLEIRDFETGEVAKDYKGNELVWVSKADQDWEIFGIPGGKKYKLVETVTPEGYQEGMIIDGKLVNEYEFYIGNKETDINIELNLEVLNAPNTGISTLNLFAIGGLMVFAGYETIKIYRRKALNN